MRGPTLQNPGTLNYDVNFAEFSFGDLWQAVSFYDADGFFFQDGENSPLRDAPLPELMDRKKRDIMERKGDKEDENKRQKQQKESSAAAL